MKSGPPTQRGRTRRDGRQTLRSLTVAAAATAAGLNIGLFIDTGLSQPGAGSLDSAIVSAVSALFPDAGLKPPASPPSASPGIASHAVTGGS